MLLNFKFSLKRSLATIATISSIFASLASGLNNTVQILQRAESSTFSQSSRLLESEIQNSQQFLPSKDF